MKKRDNVTHKDKSGRDVKRCVSDDAPRPMWGRRDVYPRLSKFLFFFITMCVSVTFISFLPSFFQYREEKGGKDTFPFFLGKFRGTYSVKAEWEGMWRSRGNVNIREDVKEQRGRGRPEEKGGCEEGMWRRRGDADANRQGTMWTKLVFLWKWPPDFL